MAFFGIWIAAAVLLGEIGKGWAFLALVLVLIDD